VREAVVVAREEASGDKRLVAYYTSAEADGETSAEQLRASLLQKLPEYMVPAAYVRLERMPLTANGKLDRKALPAPEAGAYSREGYEEPEGEVERILAGIWSEVLKVERIGRHDNFFELGGHSLLATKLISRIKLDMEVEIALRDVFNAPVLSSLAEIIVNAQLARFDPGDLAYFMRLIDRKD